MTKKIKLLHTSDVHLGAYPENNDTRYSFLRKRQSETFSNVVNTALAEDVDLFLIAGDLFDSNRVTDTTVELVFKELSRLPVPTLILPGNHDFLGPDSVYNRYDFSVASPWVKVITNFNGETVYFPHLELAVWGKPDPGTDPDFRPLESIPPRTNHRWDIAMAHGHFTSVSLPERSTLITAQELSNVQRDYIALGHWEHHQIVCMEPSLACYSGAPMPLAGHSGVLTGCVILVELAEGKIPTIYPHRVLFD